MLLLILSAGSAWAIETTTPGVEAPYGWKDGITLAIAVLGAVLGILNYWNTISTRRVRLRVTPSVVYPGGDLSEAPLIGIEVVNLSTFAVTVTEVGFTLRGTKARGAVVRPMILDGKPWPRRLESREAVTLIAETPTTGKYRIPSVYAHLASGERATGRGAMLKYLRG